jgi:hypothetical protein
VHTNLKVGLEAPTGGSSDVRAEQRGGRPSGAIYVSGDEGNLIYKG